MVSVPVVEADVAVIGGGIAGASAAWALAPYARVVVLEAEDGLGFHSTGRSAAMQTETYAGGLIRQLAHGARSIVSEELGSPDEVFHDRGALWVATAGQESTFDRLVAEAREGPATFTVLTRDEACDICGALRRDVCIGGLLEQDAKSIDVDALHQQFLRLARSTGALILTNSRIRRIAHAASTWTLEADGHTVRAARLVDAAGAWADQVAAMAGVRPAGLAPLRRTAFLFPAPDVEGYGGWPFTIDADETWYFEPRGSVMLGSNCDEHPDIPRDVRAEDIDVAEAVEKINAVTSLGIRRVLKQWAGLRTFAPDRLPVIGPDSDVADFFWYAGLGGFGIMTAAALARTVAETVLGSAESWWSTAVVAQCSVTRLRSARVE